MITLFSHESKIRVRYSETDQMGYCYYGNYATYFEVGRVEAMRSIGMSYKAIEESGKMLPVISYKVDFLSPAYYDDLLTIKTTINKIEGAKLYFNYEIYNESRLKLCKAETILVFINAQSKKPTQAPKELFKLLQEYELK
jgi:acyl-CoA thioester hydrolase